jgi:hypothetical protein
LAEFVDNAIQSFESNRSALLLSAGPSFQPSISIELDSDISRIIIEDNAAGISELDFARALRTAQLPPDRSGLAEFGVGLKSAAFWFAGRWSVITTALGENVERTVHFDINAIVDGDLTDLPVKLRAVPLDRHYTRIEMNGVYQMPKGRTLGKIKDHLQSIYRKYLRSNAIEISFEGRKLAFPEIPILKASPQWDLDAEPFIWKKQIEFRVAEFGEVRGFAALRERGSTADAGFALFRRGRLIQGSADEAYRPEQIFLRPNSFRFQRLFGELDLSGFAVTHTKDGFQWEDSEQQFLESLSAALNSSDMPLLDQADDYRVNRVAASRGAITAAVNVIADHLNSVDILVETEAEEGEVAPPSQFASDTKPKVDVQAQASQTTEILTFEYAGHKYDIDVQLVDELVNGDLFAFTLPSAGNASERAVVRINLSHSFIVGTNDKPLEQLYEFIVATCVAELCARQAGVQNAGAIRRHLNAILSERS